MDKALAQEAIAKALAGDWNKAIEINERILKKNPNDTDALNRLSRAYAETGKTGKAKKIAQKVLKIDPYNPIAIKSLEKWKLLKRGESHSTGPASPQTFLEEPGKTKIVSLLHLGSARAIAKLDAGDEVKLNTKSHRVGANSHDGKYLGRLPDDISARLKTLARLGNEYKVFIKSTSKNDVKVFIKEVKRSDKLKDVPSFPAERIDYISFTPPELVHKKENTITEENEEVEE